MLEQDTPASCMPAGEIPEGIELLGRAGTGTETEIWKVVSTTTGTPLAWKRPQGEYAADPQTAQRLIEEAAILSAVASPYVVPVQCDLSHEQPPSFFLRWLDGETLRERIDRDGFLSPGTAFWYARQIAQGLEAFARAGRTHGDVRPSKIFLDGPGGQIRLIGPAACEERDSADVETAPYLAPERQLPTPIDRFSADVYSLGVTVVEMLTGRPPFTGENATDVLRLHRQAKPVVFEELRRSLPAGAIELLESMLAKQPLRRPGNPANLVRRFLEWELESMTLRSCG